MLVIHKEYFEVINTNIKGVKVKVYLSVAVLKEDIKPKIYKGCNLYPFQTLNYARITTF